jgi:hypothetical protein
VKKKYKGKEGVQLALAFNRMVGVEEVKQMFNNDELSYYFYENNNF